MLRRKAATLGAVLLLASPFARADDAPAEAFSRATSLASTGRCEEAIPLFLDSHAKDPAVGSLLGAADCLERTGRWRAAVDRYREAEALARDKEDERAPEIERTRRGLEER